MDVKSSLSPSGNGILLKGIVRFKICLKFRHNQTPAPHGMVRRDQYQTVHQQNRSEYRRYTKQPHFWYPFLNNKKLDKAPRKDFAFPHKGFK